MAGKVILLNGAPRAGKSTVAASIRDSFPGEWLVFGVDAFIEELPVELRPGIGLRPYVPGDEDVAARLGPLVSSLYDQFHERLLALSSSQNVVGDVGYHDGYAHPLESARRILAGREVLFVGVRCPIEEIMDRRNANPHGYATGPRSDPPEPVRRWQEAVHRGRVYDVEVDTSRLTPRECADTIWEALGRPSRLIREGSEN